MNASRKSGVFAITFAIAFSIIYILCTEMNWAAFTYHSALGQFSVGPSKPINGPAMYWFGWITTSAISAAVIATIVAYLPDNLTRKVPVASVWAVPLLAIVTACGLMIKMYFLR